MTNNTPDYKDNLYFPQLKEGENSFKATFDNHFSLKKTEGLDFSELLQNSGNVANNVANKNSQHLTNYDILKEYEAHNTPLPSYEEWKEYQELDEDNKRNSQLAIRFSIEADILKELLKEVFVAINEGSYFDQCDILKKIDEVLK